MVLRRHVDLLALLLVTISIKIFSLFPDAVEQYYSNGVYPLISRAQRLLLGWIPFSIGDILYFIAGLYLLLKVVALIKVIVRKKMNSTYLLRTGKSVVCGILAVYIFFNVLWGLNYNRSGIAEHLGLTQQEIKAPDLLAVMEQIVVRLNELDSAARLNRQPLEKKRNLFEGSISSYTRLEKLNQRFHYSTPSVKPSLYSYLGNYMGFTGYYNPFSGEAQVNTTVPAYIQPFVTCHEIGHQLGYAKESEANFAGYLSASSSDNPAFRYSAYFDLYLYGRRYVYLQDSIQGKQLDSLLRPGVKKDIRDLRDFVKRHANPVEDFIDLVYGEYLKANEQPSGRVSYSEVIVWVIAYYKKHGKI